MQSKSHVHIDTLFILNLFLASTIISLSKPCFKCFGAKLGSALQFKAST